VMELFLLREEENKFNSARDAQFVINPEKIVANSVLGDAELQCNSLIQ